MDTRNYCKLQQRGAGLESLRESYLLRVTGETGGTTVFYKELSLFRNTRSN